MIRNEGALAGIVLNPSTPVSVLEDVVEQTMPLAPDGIFALHGTDGTIQIYGSNSSGIKIVAIKKALSPARLAAWSGGLSISTREFRTGH